MNEPMYVAFSTQKGGAGKTTLTVLVASYLHYVKGYNVAVIDCDYPQHSIVEMRGRDINASIQDDHYKILAFEQFKRLKKKAYPVMEGKPETALSVADELLKTDPTVDFVFFDLPGTINNAGVVRTLAAMDYIFVPISADRVVMESSLRFAAVLNDTLVTTGKANIKEIYMLWNFVDRREKTDLYKDYEKIMNKLGISVLKTFLPDSKRFRKEVSSEHRALFRSTLFPVDKTLLRDSNIDILTNEILAVLKR